MIYFVQDGEYIKIGHCACNNFGEGRSGIEARLGSLQTGNPRPLRILATMEGDIPFERMLHNKFKDWHIQGEWFVGGTVLLDYIKYATPYKRQTQPVANKTRWTAQLRSEGAERRGTYKPLIYSDKK